MAESIQQQMQRLQAESSTLGEKIAGLQDTIEASKKELRRLQNKIEPQPRKILRKRWEISILNGKLWQNLDKLQEIQQELQFW